ncbi:MAG TPA: hypothetical protein VFG63_17010 [Nocardioidaceae bacterium]|nr:hypothetical protein [Nocardioidaceae bacterium]
MSLRPSLTILLGFILLSGCGLWPDQEQSPPAQDENARIVADLGRQWRALPRVSTVEAGYLDDTDNVPGIKAEIVCRGCDVDTIGEGVVADVWSSRLSPLSGINVHVVDDGTGQEFRGYYATVRDEAELSENYGERPAGTTLD